MHNREKCLEQLFLLSAEQICSAEHATWLLKEIPRAASRFINTWPQYKSLRSRLETLNARTTYEALFLLANGLPSPLKCKCGSLRSFFVGGKSGYPRKFCGSCSVKDQCEKLVLHKNKIVDGLSGHQRAALKAAETKRNRFDDQGRNVYQQIADRTHESRSYTMAKHVSNLTLKNPEAKSNLYVLRCDAIKSYKIGITKDPQARLLRMQKDIGSNIDLIFLGEGILWKVAKLEKDLHEYLEADRNLQPKGFPGRTEWFKDTIPITELEDLLANLANDVKIEYFEGVEYGLSLS